MPLQYPRIISTAIKFRTLYKNARSSSATGHVNYNVNAKPSVYLFCTFFFFFSKLIHASHVARSRSPYSGFINFGNVLDDRVEWKIWFLYTLICMICHRRRIPRDRTPIPYRSHITVIVLNERSDFYNTFR